MKAARWRRADRRSDAYGERARRQFVVCQEDQRRVDRADEFDRRVRNPCVREPIGVRERRIRGAAQCQRDGAEERGRRRRTGRRGGPARRRAGRDPSRSPVVSDHGRPGAGPASARVATSSTAAHRSVRTVDRPVRRPARLDSGARPRRVGSRRSRSGRRSSEVVVGAGGSALGVLRVLRDRTATSGRPRRWCGAPGRG